jgi:PAS domain-containing protein
MAAAWTECVHPEDVKHCVMTYAQAFDRRESFRMEYRLRRHDGVYRWLLDTGVPRLSADGEFAGYIGFVCRHHGREARQGSALASEPQADGIPGIGNVSGWPGRCTMIWLNAWRS